MADFSTTSQASANNSPVSNSFMPTSSFTSLLNSHDYSFAVSPTTAGVTQNSGDRIAERRGSTLPKFMSIPPPSLPLSPPPVSSSCFAITPGLSPSGLLDSPVFLCGSNILASPTTGSFPFHAFNWNNNFTSNQQDVKNEENIYSDLSFQSQISGSQTTILPSGQTQEEWKYEEPIGQNVFSAEKTNSQISSRCQEAKNSYKGSSSQKVSERKSSEDGYNWKKYGQKQVKGSENPRSYYKCTYPNCPTKKKVETSLMDGHITEIVYRGSHNHPKPQSTRKSSSSTSSIKCYNTQINDTTTMDQPFGFVGNGQMDSAATTENSSITMGDDDVEQTSQITKSSQEEVVDDEPHAKRWKENKSEGISAPGSRTVREPRVVLQTTSDIDILDDGYRWRKYGQKVVNGNPNPRSYYKCTSTNCGVRKQVERAMDDARSVITTYQGKHNHNVPAARGSGNTLSVTRPLPTIPSNNALAFDSY